MQQALKKSSSQQSSTIFFFNQSNHSLTVVVDFSATFSTSFGLSRLTVANSGLSMGTLILGIPSSNEDRTCGPPEGLILLGAGTDRSW